MVDWGTLVGTALGALVGAGSTIAAERFRFKRDYASRELTLRRELYGQYLAALSLATHRLRDLRRPGPLTAQDRMRSAGEVLGDSGAYQLRYQMMITAPDALENHSEHAFESLRNLRDRFDGHDVCNDPGWDAAIKRIDDALDALRSAMRADLSA